MTTDATIIFSEQELNALALLAGTRIQELVADGTYLTTKAEAYAVYTSAFNKIHAAVV